MATLPTHPTHPTQLRAISGYWTTYWHDDEGRRRCKRFGNVRRVAMTDATRAFLDFLTRWHNDQTVRNPGRVALSVNTLAERYLAHAKTYYRKNGQETSEVGLIEAALADAKAVAGTKAANDFQPADLLAARKRAIASGLTRGGVNRRANLIRRMYAWGVEQQLVPASVWHALKAVRPLKKGRTAAKEADRVLPVESHALRAAYRHLPPTVRAMVRLQYLTGMRPGEVCAMRRRDLEFAHGRPVRYRPASHKTQHLDRERVIALGPKAQRVVMRYLPEDPSAYLFTPAAAVAERGGYGRAVQKHYNKDSYRSAVEHACRKAKVDTWSPGQLRHNAATRLRAAYGLDVARAVLGHATVATTDEYAELDHRAATRAMAKMG